MTKIKVGDIVARKSYGLDVLFKVSGVKEKDGEKFFELKGICCRLMADAPEKDLEVAPRERVAKEIGSI
jgi:spore coat assembly protein